jgi:predicted O-methyltransferase YrrM
LNPDLRTRIEKYIESLFIPRDPVLAQNLSDAAAAGLPQMQVSPNQGQLLYLLAKMSGARRVLEIGTLGGYSTTWLARALPEGGTVTSLELNRAHADVARKNVDRTGIGERVSIEVGPAEHSLQRLIDQRVPPFDLIFIDADKPGYPRYLELSLRLARPGTVILADNLIREGAVVEEGAGDANARAARTFNAILAAHARLESIIIPVLGKKVDGMSISVVK